VEPQIPQRNDAFSQALFAASKGIKAPNDKYLLVVRKVTGRLLLTMVSFPDRRIAGLYVVYPTYPSISQYGAPPLESRSYY